MNFVEKNGLKISSTLFEFVNNAAIPGTGVVSEDFWSKFSKVVHELAPINKALIKKRETVQKKIDDWHVSNKGKDFDKVQYVEFLKSINYLVRESDDFKIKTKNVDYEISSVAGPQLVVPVDNARYALNAANARWGSLYDALYGTDVIPGKKFKDYNSEGANKVVDYVRNFLNEIAPLEKIDWKEISKIFIEKNSLFFLSGSEKFQLKNTDQFVGFNGDKDNPSSILIKNNNLHIEIKIDSNSIVGKGYAVTNQSRI